MTIDIDEINKRAFENICRHNNRIAAEAQIGSFLIDLLALDATDPDCANRVAVLKKMLAEQQSILESSKPLPLDDE